MCFFISWMYQQLLVSMMNQQSLLVVMQNQVSIGKCINVVLDDFVGVGCVISFNYILVVNIQYIVNIDVVSMWLDMVQFMFNLVNDLYNSVCDFILQVFNGLLVDSDCQVIVIQFMQMCDQLLQMVNIIDVIGQVLFVGISSNIVLFVKNVDGSVSYVGNDGQLWVSIGVGFIVLIGEFGSVIFMDVVVGNGCFVVSVVVGNIGMLVVGENVVFDFIIFVVGIIVNGGYMIIFDGVGNWNVFDGGGNLLFDSGGNLVIGIYIVGGSISFNGFMFLFDGELQVGDLVSIQVGVLQDIFIIFNIMIMMLQGGGSLVQMINMFNCQLEVFDNVQVEVMWVEVDIGGCINVFVVQCVVYQDFGVIYKSMLLDMCDVDVYQVISNFLFQFMVLQVLQQVFVQVKLMSLFNYIKQLWVFCLF